MTATAERFWSKVTMGDGCWEWQGTRGPGGYGSFGMNGRGYGAHRAAWIITHGDIEPGLVVRHKCDNRICVRPDHLELGTHGDNAQDSVVRGRKVKHPDPFISIGRAALDLGVRRDTLRQQIHNGRLRATMLGGWHVKRSEVERYRQESLGRRGPAATRTTVTPKEVERYRKEHKR